MNKEERNLRLWGHLWKTLDYLAHRRLAMELSCDTEEEHEELTEQVAEALVDLFDTLTKLGMNPVKTEEQTADGKIDREDNLVRSRLHVIREGEHIAAHVLGMQGQMTETFQRLEAIRNEVKTYVEKMTDMGVFLSNRVDDAKKETQKRVDNLSQHIGRLVDTANEMAKGK